MKERDPALSDRSKEYLQYSLLYRGHFCVRARPHHQQLHQRRSLATPGTVQSMSSSALYALETCPCAPCELPRPMRLHAQRRSRPLVEEHRLAGHSAAHAPERSTGACRGGCPAASKRGASSSDDTWRELGRPPAPIGRAKSAMPGSCGRPDGADGLVASHTTFSTLLNTLVWATGLYLSFSTGLMAVPKYV